MHTTQIKPPLHVVILAAGKGTRMHSELPKVMHPVAGKALLLHVVETAQQLDPAQIHVVYGSGGDLLRKTFADLPINWIEQKHQLGTGHAVQQALPHIPEDSTVLILYGDVPLITEPTLSSLAQAVTGDNEGSLGVIITKLENPAGFGRILRDAENKVVAIVEEKDTDDKQRLLQEINCGIMAASGAIWHKYLAKLTNENAQKEYYLTDVLSLAVADNTSINKS